MLPVSRSSDLEPALGVRKLTASAVFFVVRGQAPSKLSPSAGRSAAVGSVGAASGTA